ncbi:hypothetical protein [Streptomyces hawaiiensis]|uniref:hypothetical protein n=1 Tax=Streptomyces hawaiiensis TaxID=67305 RepID=UPI001FE970AF|nr:hypothetical protein [Streptomyces hawaiiensis]
MLRPGSGTCAEVETGLPVPGQGGVPRAEFDPAQRTVAEREEAKAAELTVAGQQTSAVTVRRMRARYREKGLWGLVDQRTARRRSVVGRADERVVAAITQVLEAQRETLQWHAEPAAAHGRVGSGGTHGPGAVEVPPVTTFNRLVHALADGHGLLGSAAQQRRRTSRPALPSPDRGAAAG